MGEDDNPLSELLTATAKSWGLTSNNSDDKSKFNYKSISEKTPGDYVINDLESKMGGEGTFARGTNSKKKTFNDSDGEEIGYEVIDSDDDNNDNNDDDNENYKNFNLPSSTEEAMEFNHNAKRIYEESLRKASGLSSSKSSDKRVDNRKIKTMKLVSEEDEAPTKNISLPPPPTTHQTANNGGNKGLSKLAAFEDEEDYTDDITDEEYNLLARQELERRRLKNKLASNSNISQRRNNNNTNQTNRKPSSSPGVAGVPGVGFKSRPTTQQLLDRLPKATISSNGNENQSLEKAFIELLALPSLPSSTTRNHKQMSNNNILDCATVLYTSFIVSNALVYGVSLPVIDISFEFLKAGLSVNLLSKRLLFVFLIGIFFAIQRIFSRQNFNKSCNFLICTCCIVISFEVAESMNRHSLEDVYVRDFLLLVHSVVFFVALFLFFTAGKKLMLHGVERWLVDNGYVNGYKEKVNLKQVYGRVNVKND